MLISVSALFFMLRPRGILGNGVSGVRVGGGGRPRRGLETGGRTTRATVRHPPFRERRAPLLLMKVSSE
jgi:hypothetical protein